LLLYGATLPDVTRRQGEGETRGTNGTRDEGFFIVGMGNKKQDFECNVNQT